MDPTRRVVHDSQGGLDTGLSLDDLLEPGVDYRRPPTGSLYDLVPLGDQRVLDAGCGLGRFRPELERRGARYTGLDLPGNDVSVIGDLRRLPFRAGSFDRVLSSAVIEHLARHAIRVTRLRTFDPNLEDVFLRLTGHSLRD